MRTFRKLISSLLTLTIAFSIVPSVYSSVNASTAYTYYTTSQGIYPVFNDETQIAEYVKTCILNNQVADFYYSGDLEYYGPAIKDFISSIFSKVIAHDGNGSHGDYLNYNRLDYTYQYTHWTVSGLYLFKFTYDSRTSAEQESALQSKIDSIISSLSLDEKNDYQKVLAIYSWITSHITYDNSVNENTSKADLCYTAYKAAINGSSVCEGVSLLFYRLCLDAGLDCRIVSSDNHAWNIVKVGDSYYNADATWDLGVNPSSYRYFLQPSSGVFAQEHTFTDSLYSVYEIASTACDSAAFSDLNTVTVNSNVTSFVQRLYTVVMNRDYDDSGVRYWGVKLTLGSMNGADVARNFFYSSEFSNRTLSDSQFVGILYSTFFDRAGDEGGTSYWLSLLSSGTSRNEIIERFINTAEWANICLNYGITSGTSVAPTVSITPSDNIIAFAERMYTTALNRASDPSGLQYWSTELASRRISGAAVAENFFFSAELIGQNLSNKEYVNRMYRTFFGREADTTGFDYWVGLLNNGTSRHDVFDGFVNSDEFDQICQSYGIIRS